MKRRDLRTGQIVTPWAAEAHLIADAMARGDAGSITDALGITARRRGMSRLAESTGLNRQALYSAPGADGNPTLNTVLKVLDALDLELTVRGRRRREQARRSVGIGMGPCQRIG